MQFSKISSKLLLVPAAIIVMLTLTDNGFTKTKPQATSLPSNSLQTLQQNSTTTNTEQTDEAKQDKSISSEMALAEHLSKQGAKMYGAYWCPHCSNQKQFFGEKAFSKINYIECDPRGKNPQVNLCRSAKITGFPTWEINGKMYQGMRSLNDLATLSGYRGSRNFKN
jgi:glutaredoxin